MLNQKTDIFEEFLKTFLTNFSDLKKYDVIINAFAKLSNLYKFLLIKKYKKFLFKNFK